MKKRVRGLWIAVTLAVVLSLAAVVMLPPSLVPGTTREVGTGGLPLSTYDLSVVPQSVTEDATELAAELFEDHQEKRDDFVDQLLATYLEAKDKDFILLFNSGGFGWNLLEVSPDWYGIFTGIQSVLDSSGYTSLWLDYQRTADSIEGRLDELMSVISLYPAKARDLAFRVEFLTGHIPDLRVIVCGESNGTIISDMAMDILRDNPRVYSIQTGPPFWHKNIMMDRTLVMRSGIIPDAFSQGDFFTMLSATLEDIFGFPRAENAKGNIFFYIGAPGHEYWWQTPGVYSQITGFLEQILG